MKPLSDHVVQRVKGGCVGSFEVVFTDDVDAAPFFFGRDEIS